MAYNHQQVPFWDFIRNFDPNVGAGAGVDHQTEGMFGPGRGGPPPPPGAWGFGGPAYGHTWGGPGHCGRGPRRGRHHRRDGSHDAEHHGSRDGSPNAEHDHPAGEGEAADHAREGSPHRHEHGPHSHGHHGPPPGRRGGMGRGGWGHQGRAPHGSWGRGGWGGQARQGPFPGPNSAFDISALIESLSAHPLAQAFRSYTEQAAGRSGEPLVPEEEAENTFTPPIDVFCTPSSYILHVALPGAKKEDVGVNWDAEKGVLHLAGVVYRHGDEAFLKTLSQGERKVGVFERTVKLPPAGGNEEKEEVDGEAITAKLEDGVLVVTVPKMEREWTEVKRVDIE